MTKFRFRISFQFRDNSLSQDLAQFHSPLVERINVPYDTLGEYDVLIKSNQHSKYLWCKLFGKNCIGRPVTIKYLMGSKPFRCSFGSYLFKSFAESQCLSLGEYICHKNIMVPSDGIHRFSKSNKVTWYQSCTLVYQLVK